MSVFERLLRPSGGRHHLRRVSLEKARPLPAARHEPPLSQVGEKFATAGVATVLVLLLLGAGALDTAREWCALAAILSLSAAGLARYLRDFRPVALARVPGLVGLLLAVIAPLAGLVLWERYLGPADLAWLPLAFFSLIIALSWGRALAIEATLFSTCLVGAYLVLHGRSGSAEAAGLLVAAGGGFTAALAAQGVKRRSALFRIGVGIGCVQGALAAGVLMLDSSLVLSPVHLTDVLRVVLLGIATGLIVSGLLPAVEVLLDVTTDISLLELGNTNESPLLRKLLIEASGTFHHSYVVGLLAEASAEAIGANALLARVGALYHDVGKLNKPEYFAENSPTARDRHKPLAPEMSMLIISAHTRDGVELGRYYGLPHAILAFMIEHHGTTCVEYFYHRAVDLRGEDEVSEGSFRYSGPKPQSRETAIVMLADAAEAISRQMPDPSLARLEEMVHRVSMKRLMDGQFSECGLTLEQLNRIEAAFVQVLSAINHTRPTYPKGKPHPLDLSQPESVSRVDEAQLATSGARVLGQTSTSSGALDG